MAAVVPITRQAGNLRSTPLAAGSSGVVDVVPRGTVEITWEAIPFSGVPADDRGAGVQLTGYPDKTVSFRGTFGAAGRVQLKYSEDSTNGLDGTWSILKDQLGNDIDATAAAEFVVAGNTQGWIRPEAIAGDGTTAISCYLMGA